MTQRQKLKIHNMEHPLKVYYPFGGKHIITIWWTRNEQNHVAIARNLSAMDFMLNCFIDKYPDCIVKESYEVEMVSPSEKLCNGAAYLKYKEDVDIFFDQFAYSMHEALEEGYSLPSIFNVCTNWICAYDDSSLSESQDKEHRYCKNCHYKITLSFLTKEQFYESYYSKWIVACPPRVIRDKNAGYSLAEPAKDDEVIWGAYTNFGHHNTGVTISKVIQSNTEAILFYFRKLNYLSILGYQKLQKEKEKQRSESRKLWEKEHLASIKAHKKQNIEEALSIFN